MPSVRSVCVCRSPRMSTAAISAPPAGLPGLSALAGWPGCRQLGGEHRVDVVHARAVRERAQRVAQRGVARRHVDAAQDALLGLRAEPGHAAQPAAPDGLGELGRACDAELADELQRALGPDSGHLGQLGDAGRYLGAQLFQRLEGARPAALGDLRGDRRADAVDRGQRLVGQRGEVRRVPRDGLGGPLVVPGAERVAAGEPEQFRVLPQQRRGFLVRRCHAPIVAPVVARRCPERPVSPWTSPRTGPHMRKLCRFAVSLAVPAGWPTRVRIECAP